MCPMSAAECSIPGHMKFCVPQGKVPDNKRGCASFLGNDKKSGPLSGEINPWISLVIPEAGKNLPIDK